LWEAYREGIDDHRYVTTLERAISRANEEGHKEAAANARATLDQILAAMNVQTKYKNEGLWSAETFDAWRWAIAEHILALQKLTD
jgi:SLT domain-containing protein